MTQEGTESQVSQSDYPQRKPSSDSVEEGSNPHILSNAVPAGLGPTTRNKQRLEPLWHSCLYATGEDRLSFTV